MIFSRFFTPDHAKPDPAVRKASVAQLSPDDPKSRQILHELAFNDESPDVSLAALEQLGSFALWDKMARTGKSERVKKTAKQKVRHAVLSGEGLTRSEKQAYMLESADNELVAEVLLEDDSVLDDSQLMLALLVKNTRPQLRDRVFLQRANADIKATLLAQEDDLATLQKWLKKSSDDSQPLIQQRIDAILQEQQKPKEVGQAVTLVLSKLQALVDESDFERFSTLQQTLIAEYDALAEQFHYLKEREVAQFTEKKAAIERRLATVGETLSEAFAAVKAEREKAAKLAAINGHKTAIEDEIAELMQHIDTVTMATVERLQHALQALEKEVVEAKALLGIATAEPLAQALSQLAVQLTQLPEWQRHTVAMVTLLDRFEKESTEHVKASETLGDIIKDYQQAFNDLTDPASPLSATHKKRWGEIKAHLNSAKKAHEKGLQESIAGVRKQLGVVGSLIGQGKYRAAMSRYSKVQSEVDVAKESVKQAVSRRYEEVSEQIARLEGWQEYVSGPRKPALLEQAVALIDDTQLSMSQRAQQIKQLRKSWQSLSLTKRAEQTTGPEQNENNLDTEFDRALEKAFEPCREYFAEQEEKRQQAIANKQAVITKLASLLEAEGDDPAQRYQQFEQIQKDWRADEHLRPDDYQPLKREFDALRTQVNSSFDAWLADNANAKTRLIQKAEQLLSLDDMSDAADQAKALQQKWRNIGTSGKRQDSALWKKFRKANDALFAKLGEQRQARRDAFDEQASAITAEVEAFQTQQTQLNSDEFQAQWQSLKTQAEELPKSLGQPLLSTLSGIKKAATKAREDKKHQQVLAKIAALLAVLKTSLSLTTMTELDQESEHWLQLDKSWQQALLNTSSVATTSHIESRAEALLLLEIALDLPSPDSQHAQRQAIQMQLLAQGMGRDLTQQANEYLHAWLSFGAVDEDDKTELARLQACLNKYFQVA